MVCMYMQVMALMLYLAEQGVAAVLLLAGTRPLRQSASHTLEYTATIWSLGM
jgi:hypothetical protein